MHCHDTGGIPFDGTIVGGMAQKLTRKDAAEFSFFLAVPTMFAATGYKVLKLFLDGGTEILVNNMPALIIGNVVVLSLLCWLSSSLLALLRNMALRHLAGTELLLAEPIW